MAVIFETLAYLPRWAQEPEEPGGRPALGRKALGAVDFVKGSSGLTRSTLKVLDVYYGTHYSKSFSELALPSAFNAMSGALALRKSKRTLLDRRAVQDTQGVALACFSCISAGLKIVGGTLFIPIRSLSFAERLTGSTTVKRVEKVFSSIGKGIGETLGILSVASTSMKIYEELGLMQELSVNDEPGRVLANLRGRLAANPGERSAFTRMTSQACTDAVLGSENLTAEEAQALVRSAFNEAERSFLGSTFSLALTVLGIAATAMTASLVPQVALAGAVISFILSSYGFVTHLNHLSTAFAAGGDGSFDTALLATLTLTSLAALVQTIALQDSRLFQIITLALGASWMAVTSLAYAKQGRAVDDGV